MTTTYRTFTEALASDGIEVSIGQVARGHFRNIGGDCDYQLINNNIRATHLYSNIEITDDTWVARTTPDLLEKELNETRPRKVYASGAVHPIREMKIRRFRGKLPYSFIEREVEVTKNSKGVAYLGLFQITDYTIEDDGTATITRTKIAE